jgi:hypothetical protein
MSYLLTPLHTHFDSGFGATGNGFKDAADHLDQDDEAKKGNLFNASLPINCLYRHAIELFLKSAIVIFHRRFKLHYGAVPAHGEPMVLVGAEWKTFNRVHSIDLLWTYVRKLFADHAEWLAKNTKCNWVMTDEWDEAVKNIENGDPRSTFFRYPTTKDLEADATKSAMRELPEGGLIELARQSSSDEKKVFAMVVQDEDRQFVRGYYYCNDEEGAKLSRALKLLAGSCYDLHTALRWELCGGW